MARRSDRDGMILFVIVIIVAMVSLAAITFVLLMSTEYQAANLRGDELQADNLSRSGVELIRVIAEQSPATRPNNLTDNPTLFRGQVAYTDQSFGYNGRFSVVSPRIQRDQITGVRFGLVNESSKLNLAVLTKWDTAKPGSARSALLKLPGMTVTMADAILDWSDGDRTPRGAGAEIDYYESEGLPYSPRNAPPCSIEELLLVRDVTRDLVFGTDDNMNYTIDSGRTAPGGFSGMPSGGMAGGGQLPWVHMLTVYSAEQNVNSLGGLRVDLNQNNLRQLHTELIEAVGHDWADFAVLYRQFGPARPATAAATASASDTATASAGDDGSSEAPALPENGASARSGGASQSGRSSRTGRESSSRRGESRTGPPVDLKLPGKFQLASPLDLVGTAVQAGMLTVPSPIGLDRRQLPGELAQLLDATTTVNEPVIVGRININEASRAVLESVPGMPESAVGQIISRRTQATLSSNASYASPAWPLTQGIVDLATMKQLMPNITTGGDVYRGQVVGFFDVEDMAYSRIEVVIDASTLPAKQVYLKDLTLLGRGYSIRDLGGVPIQLDTNGL